MKKYFVYIATLLFGLTACEDNTGSIGGSIIPEQDVISVNDSIYWATSKSIAVDSVLGLMLAAGKSGSSEAVAYLTENAVSPERLLAEARAEKYGYKGGV